jgi:hypothetical protein
MFFDPSHKSFSSLVLGTPTCKCVGISEKLSLCFDVDMHLFEWESVICLLPFCRRLWFMFCLINMVAPLDLCGAKEGKSSRRHPLDRLSFLSCSSDVESLRSFRFLCLLLALPALLVSSLLTDDVDDEPDDINWL